MLCKKPYMYHPAGAAACGQCSTCRINFRRQWASRMLLEAKSSKGSGFLTLTYDDDHLPKDFSLDPAHHRNFMKRLRKELPAGSLRFLGVGEYGGWLYEGLGERRVNPHYHYALFGLSCLGPITYPSCGRRCFCDVCQLLRKVWFCDDSGTGGNITMDPLNWSTANYIAGYVLKKMTKLGDDRLEGRHPEFKRSSNGGRTRKGGIGAPAMENVWNALHDAFTGQVFDVDGDVPQSVRVDGKSVPLGRYLRSRLRGFLYEETGTPKEKLLEAQAEMYDLFFAAGGYEKFTSVRDYLLFANAGNVLLFDQRSKLLQKGRVL